MVKMKMAKRIIMATIKMAKATQFLLFGAARIRFYFSYLALCLDHTPLTPLSRLGRFLFFLVAAGFLSAVLIACAGGGGGSSSGSGSDSPEDDPFVLAFSPFDGGVSITLTNGADYAGRNITAVRINARSYDAEGKLTGQEMSPDLSLEDLISGYIFGGLVSGREYEFTFSYEETLADGARVGDRGIAWRPVERNLADYNDTTGGSVRGRIAIGEDGDGNGIADFLDEKLAGEPEPPPDPGNGDPGTGGPSDDDDNDGIRDDSDQCPTSQNSNFVSTSDNDKDGDGCEDAVEDVDDDGDGLIEIRTHEELNAVRHQLDGSGYRSMAGGNLDQTGCGGADGITSCSGYELVANISLADYADDDGGKGWQPLGHDTASGPGCQGTAFSGTFEGNGFMISDLNISRSDEDCVGLFGHIADNSEIRNLTLSAEAVIGRIRVGGLVGDGESARIHSASVVVDRVRGIGSHIGSLVGHGQSVRIYSSSVVVGETSGAQNVGGLVGHGQSARIYSSSVVMGMVSGGAGNIGGLVGNGEGSLIHSSSVVAGAVGGVGNVIGGLVGFGASARVFSSSVVAGEVSGINELYIGGLVGWGPSAQIYSSSVVVDELSGLNPIGGLAGRFDSSSKVAYSYVVSGSITRMLVGEGSGAGVNSYWYSATGVTHADGNHGEAKTSSQLQMPTPYTGIYVKWDENPVVFDDGSMIDEPLAVWCDRDNSGSIETGEDIDANLIWDFGESDEYPAIECTPIAPAEWRSWWYLNSTGQPELNQTRLDELFP